MTAGDVSGRPLRRDAQRNRQRIIEAARDLFAKRGLEPNLNDVAHHAGVGVGTVYRRFDSKQDLIEAIFVDSLNQLADLAEDGLAQQDSWQGFVWFFERMCQRTATDRGAREIAFSKAYGGLQVAAAQERLSEGIQKLIERAQADGHVRPELSFSDAPIFALLAGAVGEFVGDVDGELWRRYVAIFLEGVRHRPGQHGLPVAALSAEELDAVMHTWEPAGPP